MSFMNIPARYTAASSSPRIHKPNDKKICREARFTAYLFSQSHIVASLNSNRNAVRILAVIEHLVSNPHYDVFCCSATYVLNRF